MRRRVQIARIPPKSEADVVAANVKPAITRCRSSPRLNLRASILKLVMSGGRMDKRRGCVGLAGARPRSSTKRELAITSQLLRWGSGCSDGACAVLPRAAAARLPE
eukprot:scaffold128082_cov25-Tisochrysis_lutea.AAC.1